MFFVEAACRMQSNVGSLRSLALQPVGVQKLFEPLEMVACACPIRVESIAASVCWLPKVLFVSA